MSLTISSGQPLVAKFNHESAPVSLRMQVVLVVRKHGGREVACVRLRDFPGGWRLPIEQLRVNEDPADAARRVASEWFLSPLTPRLVDIQNYPATGPEDDRWYLLFVYEAQAPAEIKPTPDTDELVFTPVGKAPGNFDADHASVFARLAP